MNGACLSFITSYVTNHESYKGKQMESIALFLNEAVGIVAWVGLAVLALSMFVVCVVLMRAPEVADRAISFDLAMVHVVGIIALSAIVLNQFMLLDTLIVVSVLGFLGTVTIARYLERGLHGSMRVENQQMTTSVSRKETP